MITLDHVSKMYKSSARPALDNVSVKIDKGEFVFLIGPSGSGKSTFMRLLLAEDTPSSGDIRVSKFHVNKLAGRHIPGLRQVLGCVFQDFRLLQQKSVFENVAFALEVIGKRSEVINRVVPDVLEMVGLSGKANRLPTSCPVVNSSAWRSPERSSTGRWCCWPTSRPATWTPRPARTSWIYSSASTAPGRRW